MVSANWIVRIVREHAPHLARLRGVAGLDVAETTDTLWLRASAGDDAKERLLRTVGGQPFTLFDGDLLVPWGMHVPTERLPRLDWLPIATWATIALPVAALPGQLASRVRLQVVRGGAERPPAAILADYDAWFTYATAASEVRLRPLAFAVSVDRSLRERMGEKPANESARRVFILGTPLPPTPGQHYAVDDGIALPCGWTLSPAVGSTMIRKVLGLAEGDMALFASDGTFERIAAELFVRASRSAVRATAPGDAYV